MGQSLTRGANLPPPPPPPPAHCNQTLYQLQQPANSTLHFHNVRNPALQQQPHSHLDSSHPFNSLPMLDAGSDPNLHNAPMHPNADLFAGPSVGIINNEETVLTVYSGTVTEYFPLGEPVTIQHYAQDQYDHPPSPDPYPLNENMQGQVVVSTDDQTSSDEDYYQSSVDSVHDYSFTPLDSPTDEVAASSASDDYVVLNPTFGHTGRVNPEDPEDVREVKINNLRYKYSYKHLQRVELRAVTENGVETGEWDFQVDHAQHGLLPFRERFRTRIQPDEADLTYLVNWCRGVRFVTLQEFRCDHPPELQCANNSLYPRHICSVHYWGTEEQRIEDIELRITERFSAPVLRFVVGRDFLGFTTDPEKLQIDDFNGFNFWHVHPNIIKEILDKFVILEAGGHLQ